MTYTEELVDALAACELFAGLDRPMLAVVAGLVRLETLPAEAVIFHQGDTGASMYFVKSGHVVSMARDVDGNEREVYEFGPGRFFGEMSIIDNAPRSATCEVLEEAELLVLDAIDFYRIVWEHAEIGVLMLVRMAKIMAGWLDEASLFLQDIVRWGETARKRAVIDEMSGLFNRRFLEEAMRSRLSRHAGRVPASALLMLDIDNFHDINSQLGVEAGDAVIASAGAIYSTLMPEGGVAARLSGDEFAFFLPGLDYPAALELAEVIRCASEQLFLEFRPGPGAAPVKANLSVSLGVAAAPAHASDARSLYQAADKALFMAKEAGRNRVVLFPDSSGN